MTFIDASYFTKGPRKIDNAVTPLRPGIVAQATTTAIEGYIDYYQRSFLDKVFGLKAGKEYDDYIKGEKPDESKDTVLNQLKEPFANYVMYHFLRGQQTSSGTVGEKQLKSVNESKSAASRQSTMWNDMVELMRNFVLWTQEHHADACVDKSLLTKINVYGL